MMLASANPLEFNLFPFITTMVVFGTVAVGLGIFVWPKILKGLDDRNAKILGEIAAAEAARTAAAAKQKEFEQKLQEAMEQSSRMIREAKAEAVRMGEELRARSEAELAERARRAQDEIESARRTAVAELEAHAATLAVSIASRILKREISATDQKRMVEESLAGMQGKSR
ncbi:MAG: F0F1 ATP synthase subunit B [Planctomycetes bacterium]|nr:F0F1 ATP synthase subunit B [Planctomycetota bacterium]